MGTTNEKAAARAKAERRVPPSEVYDPHFPAKRRTPPQNRAETFDPHFPPVRQH